MKVVAVVPTLDEEAQLGACLVALRRAGVGRVVVVDGGSRDRTVTIAREAGCDVVRSLPGRARQLNRGACRAVDADVLWFVHADARVPSDGRAAIATALQDPGVVGGAFRIRTVVDGRGRRAAPWLAVADLRSCYTRRFYGDQALFVRRDVFERVGGYPPQALFEDLALCRRLEQVGRLVRARGRVEVSGRRFLARPLYYTAVMNLFPALYRVGVDPALLRRFYPDQR